MFIYTDCYCCASNSIGFKSVKYAFIFLFFDLHHFTNLRGDIILLPVIFHKKENCHHANVMASLKTHALGQSNPAFNFLLTQTLFGNKQTLRTNKNQLQTRSVSH